MSAPALLEPRVAGGERAARRSLRLQLEHLEAELAGLDMRPLPTAPAGVGTARLLSLGELEVVRDQLARLLADTRRAQTQRAGDQERNRDLVEEMLLDPASHRWARVTSAAVGDPGCRQWRVRPRFGLLGVLGNWWRVHISSGCP